MLAVIAAVACGAPASGDVVSQDDNGFQLRTAVTVAAPAAEVFNALINDVGQWWNSAHTYGGDASRLSIDPRPGGCFCEALADGAVQHLVVSYVNKGQALRLLGGLGPLQELGVSGALSFSLRPTDETTVLAVTYNVSGFFAQGTADWAAAVDGVVAEQVQRLKAHIEGSGT